MDYNSSVVPIVEGTPIPPPTSEQLYQTSTLLEDLYRHRPPEGRKHSNINTTGKYRGRNPIDKVNSGGGKEIRLGRAGGPSGMKVEHLKACLWAGTR